MLPGFPPSLWTQPVAASVYSAAKRVRVSTRFARLTTVCSRAPMKLHLAHVLPLLSAWARAQAPIAAPLNISWDPWTNFSWSKLLHHGTCGGSKCYFPASTLAPPGPSSSAAAGERGAQGQAMGWLILPQSHIGWHLSDWMKTWELAKDLHTRYGANHLLIGPPRRIALGNSDAALLNAHLWLEQRHRVGKRYAEGNVLVQPVRSCPPSSCLLMGCGHGGKERSFTHMLAAFLEHVHDKATFMHALEQSVRSVNAMVRATPCLQRDFQVFVRNDGQILHLDLDRCFSTGTPNAACWTDDCFGNALALINTKISKSENRSGSSLSPGRCSRPPCRSSTTLSPSH